MSNKLLAKQSRFRVLRTRTECNSNTCLISVLVVFIVLFVLGLLALVILGVLGYLGGGGPDETTPSCPKCLVRSLMDIFMEFKSNIFFLDRLIKNLN